MKYMSKVHSFLLFLFVSIVDGRIKDLRTVNMNRS
jgi:hypothetical protein